MAKEKCRFKSAVIRPRTILYGPSLSPGIFCVIPDFLFRDMQAVVDNYDYNQVDIADIHGGRNNAVLFLPGRSCPDNVWLVCKDSIRWTITPTLGEQTIYKI